MSTKTDPAASPLSRTRHALQGIALLEAVKGGAALVVGVGLIELLHHDLRHLVRELVGHFGLDPAAPMPLLMLQWADQLNHTPLTTLELLLAVYMALRLTEAYGLWQGQVWAEWLGALSGGLYVPFELHHLWHVPNLLSASVLLLNLLVVGFLAWRLWRR